MPYSNINGVVGNQQVALFGLPDTTARHLPGSTLSAVDNYWGGAEFIYAKAGGTIPMAATCAIVVTVASGQTVFTASAVGNTANLACPVYVAMTSMTVGQFGWFCMEGLVPVASGASVAADTSLGITAAGILGAVAAGKQILGLRNMLPATTTVVKAGVANSGSTVLSVPNGSDGWFIGAYLSGTGIAATTRVVDIDPSGTQVTLSAATTAAVNGNVTATYNNATIFYNVALMNRPHAQGAIT